MTGPVIITDGAGLPYSTTNPIPTTPVAAGVDQDVNIAAVAGAATAVGHGVAATALRVELPTDGTGVVGLIAGSATIGNIGQIGDSYSHITTATTTTVKNAPGTVKAVVVNTKGTVASTITVKDNATTIAIIDSLNLAGTFTLNVACATSIVVVTTGTVAPDVTVTYQ